MTRARAPLLAEGKFSRAGGAFVDRRPPLPRPRKRALTGWLGAAAGGAVAAGLLGGLVAGRFFQRIAGMDAGGAALTVGLWALAGALAGLAGRGLGARVRRPRYRLLGALGAGLPALWLFGDFQYALLVKHCYANWEAGVERGPDGVRSGCGEFSVGTGATAVLLVHGFGDSPAVYSRMAPALAAKGFTCRAMRLPHFATPAEDMSRASAAEWSQAVRDRLHELRRDHPRVVVIGHSLGGAVTLDCLAREPGAADAVVLLAPLVEVSSERSPLLAAETWYHLLDHTLVFTDRIGMPLPDGLADHASLKWMNVDQFIPRPVYREMFALVDANRRRGGGLSAPLLLVLSGKDWVVDNRAAEALFRRCTGPKRLKWLPETSHIIPLDEGWEAVTEDIARFIRALPDRPYSPPTRREPGPGWLANVPPAAPKPYVKTPKPPSGRPTGKPLAFSVLTNRIP